MGNRSAEQSSLPAHSSAVFEPAYTKTLTY